MENSAAAAPASSPPSRPPGTNAGVWRHQDYIQGTGESVHLGRPSMSTHRPQEAACLNLWDWRLLKSWAGGWPSAGPEWRRAKLSLLSQLQPKRPQKLAWPL